MKLSSARAAWNEFQQLPIVRFAFVGAITTVLDISVFATLVHEAGLPAYLANICSYSMGIVLSFALNRALTFNDKSSGSAMARRFAGFAAVYLVALVLSTALVASFNLLMPEVAAKIVSVPLVFLWSYAAMRFFVFRSEAN